MENLKYLKDQRVCERLESMVRHVLLSRPEDPVLAMCNFMNDVNRSGSSVRLAAQQNRNGADPVTRNSSSRTESRVSAPVAAAAPVAAVAPTSARRAEPQPAAASPVTARAMPFPTDSRRGSVVPHSRGGSATGMHMRIERDDSARSEVSAFSVTSVDMAEFLSDFRAAHFSLFGAVDSDMSIDDLADVVDRVALPIPDTRLLSDLYHEMEAVTASGTVPFSAFLARMSYRIAGKYHLDVIRSIFFVLVRSSSLEASVQQALEQRLGSVDDLASLLEEDIAVRTAAASAANSHLASPHAVVSPTVAAKGNGGVAAAAAPSAVTGTLACTTIDVPVSQLIDATLRGIGIRLQPAQVEEALSRVGVHSAAAPVVSLNVVDLARFLSTATALAAPSAHPLVQHVPSVGCDLNELSVSERDC